jgi:hypothetical protein
MNNRLPFIVITGQKESVGDKACATIQQNYDVIESSDC